MKVKLIIAFCFLIISSTSAQERDSFFARTWKCYSNDLIIFDYLRLDMDGTGIKGLGQTIRKKDKIFANSHSRIKIKDWRTGKDTLFIYYEDSLVNSYLSNIFIVKKNSKYQFEALGEHLQYSEHVPKEELKKTVIYEDEEVLKEYGSEDGKCFPNWIPFTFEAVDETYKLAVYGGFENLISQIAHCSNVTYYWTYKDFPYSIKILKDLDDISFHSSTNQFEYILHDENDSLKTNSISIKYDFFGDHKDYYSQNNKKKKQEKFVMVNGKKIYLLKKWGDTYSAETLYENNISVFYYTKDKSQEKILRKCITSLKFENKEPCK